MDQSFYGKAKGLVLSKRLQANSLWHLGLSYENRQLLQDNSLPQHRILEREEFRIVLFYEKMRGVRYLASWHLEQTLWNQQDWEEAQKKKHFSTYGGPVFLSFRFGYALVPMALLYSKVEIGAGPFYYPDLGKELWTKCYGLLIGFEIVQP